MKPEAQLEEAVGFAALHISEPLGSGSGGFDRS